MRSRIVILLITICNTGIWEGLLAQARIVPVGKGWAGNSVNTTIFRHNSVVTHGENQYVAYYDADGYVILARRQHGSDQWEVKKTPYQGNVKDAHNGISIIVDGDGYLHMAWDHHVDELHYCRSVDPGSLELTQQLPMTGKNEQHVTYPEFYRLKDGNLLFLYRDGQSGSGNLMINHYNTRTKSWSQRQNGFINGEGKRNAYWQLCTDAKGSIHISWVWRETGDVATNHDMGYAKSTDGGISWQKSDGEPYALPITLSTAEYASLIPQRHELINSTAMCADADGHPYIATYFKPEGTTIPQYHLIYHNGTTWITRQISKRTTPFSLRGGGTKRIPISRPRILARSVGNTTGAYLLFRDIERNERVSMASCSDLKNGQWEIEDLTEVSVGSWEPSLDTELWEKENELHLFVQHVGQGDGETTEDIPPQMVYILEWKPY